MKELTFAAAFALLVLARSGEAQTPLAHRFAQVAPACIQRSERHDRNRARRIW
jgi:hypothetical protein